MHAYHVVLLFGTVLSVSSFISIVLLCICLCRKRKSKLNCGEHAQNSNIALSIIIPFYNEAHRTVIQVLNAIEAQKYEGRIDVILIDDGSVNDTASYVNGWMQKKKKWNYRLSIISCNGGLKGKALDIALPLVGKSSEVVVVIDSDTILQPSAIQLAMNKLLSDERNVACCGFILPMQKKRNLIEMFQHYEHAGSLASVKFAQSCIGKVAVMAGAFSLHRTAAIKELGGWGEWLVEDVAWTWKALAKGYKVVYAHDAIAYTVCPSSLGELFKQRRRWARGKVEALKSAWCVSPKKTMILIPWLVLWLQISFFPSLLILPLCLLEKGGGEALLFFFLNTTTSIALHMAAHQPCPHSGVLPMHFRLFFSSKTIAYNALFDVINIPANILGVMDELFKRKKTWLTRGMIQKKSR